MRGLPIVMMATLASGCSSIALNALADTLSSPGKTYARDDDPRLVADALPFVLKTMEQVHEGVPKHRALCEALARGFASLGVAFVVEEANRVEETDVARARVLYARARRLLVRGRDYGLDGLELAMPGAKQTLLTGTREQRGQLLGAATKKEVGLLYWTGAAWGAAIGTAKSDMAMVGQLPAVEDMLKRALALDEAYDQGAIHEIFIVIDSGKSDKEGGGPESARKHMQRAMELSNNKKVGPLVSFAENVSVAAQNKAEFTRLLEQALAFDPDSNPDTRLVNVLAQSRARWLLSRTSDLFAE